MPSVLEFADTISGHFGTQTRRFGREFRVPCPVHEADGLHHSPSLAVWSKDDVNVAYNCMVGCVHANVTQELARLGLLPARRRLTAAEYASNRREQIASQEAAKKRAKEYLDGALLLTPDDMTHRYFESRGIVLSEPETTFLRVAEDPERPGGTCVLGIVVDCTTLNDQNIRATGISTLALSPTGTPRVDRRTGKPRKVRQIIGVRRACGVPFGTPGPVVVVGEGWESTLSAMRLRRVPFGIAALSASNLPALALPVSVRKVFIAADNDYAGMLGACQAQAAWTAQGLEVVVDVWGAADSGWDANDQLQAKDT